jgi:hypothetical protein
VTDLCDTAAVKLAAGIPVATSTADALIAVLIPAASLAIPRRYQREFAPVAATPTRRVQSDGPRISLVPYDLRNATGITIDPAGTPQALAATDWRYGPPGIDGTYRTLVLRRTYNVRSRSLLEYGYLEFDIVGTWGMSTIPADVARAAALTVASWIDRAVAQYGDSDGVPGGLTPEMASTWAIPTAAHRLLEPFAPQEF